MDNLNFNKNIFGRIFKLLSKDDKKKIFYILIISLGISLVETIGISAIMPFIAITSDISYIENSNFFSIIYSKLNFSNEYNFVIFLGLILIVFYVMRGLVNYYYYFTLSKYSHFKAHKIAHNLFDNYIRMPFNNYTKKNSSDLTKIIVHETAQFTKLISSFLIIVSEILVALFIYSFLLYVNYKITIALTVLLIMNFLFMINFVSVIIKNAGSNREKLLKGLYNFLNKNFNNIKLIKVSSIEDETSERFDILGSNYATANLTNAKLANFPRLFLETFAFIIIISITLYLIVLYKTDLVLFMGTISVFVFAFYRMLPSINRIMTSYNEILFLHRSIDIIEKDLQIKNRKLGHDQIDFNNNILLKNISFKYDKIELINMLNLEIKKYDKIGIFGESGSGKSTLLDLLMGIYKPKSGDGERK